MMIPTTVGESNPPLMEKQHLSGCWQYEEASTAPLLAAHLSGREVPLEGNGSLLFRGIDTRCEILDTGALTPAKRLEGLRSYL